MSIYIVTNRSISDDKISDAGSEPALPVFRLAKCVIREEAESAEEKVDYTLINDKTDPGYSAVADVISSKNNPDTLNGTAQMFYQLYEEMSKSKAKSDVLVFIHGFNYDFSATRKHVFQIFQNYIKPKKSNLEHIVYISWPTIGNPLFTYWNDQEDAEETGKVLARLYNRLYGFFKDMFELRNHDRCQGKIHLAVHSMGNQVLKHMLMAIDPNKQYPLFSEVALLNSDVEWTVFEEGQPFRVLEKIAERVHIYIHRSDDALRISRFTKNFNQRLGFKGPKNYNTLPAETFIVDTTDAGKLIQTEWMDKRKERSFDHWGYLYRKQVIDDLLHVFQGIDEDDITGRTKWTESNVFYYFKSGSKKNS